MASTSAPNGIVLFNYAASPFGKRVSWYLRLRGIGYGLCEQPFIMPRPDLEALGLKYRRIPLLSMGRDVYVDTRLILRKLEERFPEGRLGSDRPDERFVERLLEKYMIEGPVFMAITGLVPPSFMGDARVTADRKGFCGREWTPEALEAGRPECLAYARNLFDFLETTIFADGRKWILNTEKPALADIEAIWPLDWLVSLEGALPVDVVSEKQFPKVYRWISQFQAALEEAKSWAPEPAILSGDEAVKYISSSPFTEGRDKVPGHDPLGLKEGTDVEVYPTDWGSEHRDSGRLVGLGPDEVTVVLGNDDAVPLRLHAPRAGFRVLAIGGDA